MKKPLKSIDLFAGIGGIRLGFDKAFGDGIKTVFVSELDKYAQKTYKDNFEKPVTIAGDITQINERDIPNFDICLAGFPCQAFSLAGQHKGFDDDYKGLCRGTLFLDVARICQEHMPKVIFCENVKGLVIHDRGKTFEIIKNTFSDLGYQVFSDLLNSKDFGVPQNRERVYIVAFRNDIAPKEFDFQKLKKSKNKNPTIRDIMEKEPVSVKYYLSTTYLDTLIRHRARHEAKGNGFGYEIRDLDGTAGAIICGGMGRERNLIIDDRLTDFTPVTHIKGQVNREGIRKMTPREWARLQGFPDTYNLNLADVHLYKQFGNSVTVPVIQAIAEKIKEVLDRQPLRIITETDLSQQNSGGTFNMSNTSGNKGEWSEIYTFIRLLKDGRIYAANEDLERISETMYFPIIKIRREENANEQFDYHTGEKIKIYHNNDFVKEIKVDELTEQSEFLYNEMFTRKKGNLKLEEMKSFKNFLKDIFVTKIRADSKQKADIIMEIIDVNTGFRPLAGFSIKSQIGAPSTLMNASGATNLIYKITGIDDSIMEEINSIDTKEKIIERFTKLYSVADRIEFVDVKNEIFKDNLELIDSNMPEILAHAMVYRYRDNIKNYKNIVDLLVQSNPMNYHNPAIYRYKFKKLLCASALGMLPATQWNGIDEANGGYIIVKSDGDILAYYLHNRNAFEDYLLRSTYLETGSTSKHGFATVYKIGEEYFINMNVQIRFKA